MKQILILSCSALALSVAAAHAGDSNQSIVQQVSPLLLAPAEGNTANITQSGDFNLAGADSNWDQSGGGHPIGWNLSGVIGQNGRDNLISINQDGYEMTRNASQLGARNRLYVTQTGAGGSGLNPFDYRPNNRIWNVKQTSDPTAFGGPANKNVANIKQDGTKNVVATLEQNNTSAGNALVDKNHAKVTQTGERNGANAWDVTPFGAAKHGALLKQDGRGNYTEIVQDGDRNNFWLVSQGDFNTVNVDQLGNDSYAKEVAVGSGNTIDVDQDGDDHWSMTDLSGDNNQFKVVQKVNSNVADFIGIGDLNNIQIAQLTASNEVRVNMMGNSNQFKIRQFGGTGNIVDMNTTSSHGDGNQLLMIQEGNSNHIEASFGGIASGDDNIINAIQQGDTNMLIAHVDGSNNEVNATQNGNNNFEDISQNGNGNVVNLQQGGAIVIPAFAGYDPFAP